MTEIKAFNRWSMEGIKVDDLGLQPYITLKPRIVPRTGARYAGNRFYKSRVFIVERLINKLMIPGHKSKKHYKTSGHITGKAQTAYDIVEEAFRQIEKTTKENPIKVFVKALENAAQREEIITIEYGGARYPKAVECSPQRRVDLVLKHMTQGAYHRTFNTKKSIVSSLAEEVINAYRLSNASNAIAKKLEIERQSDSSR
ncbi:30S ribosomal protein S7 [Candidatus Woesearchaeota archaeon]|nr:30S ribosomal protein S7 [Candidatus Woesearchaeota archaeon]